MPPKYTTDEFVKKAKVLHGDKFDYSKTIYSGAKNIVKFNCNNCGHKFNIQAQTHIWRNPSLPQYCPVCNLIEKWSKFINQDEFKILKYKYNKPRLGILVSCKKCGKKSWKRTESIECLNRGCIACSNRSKGATEIFEYLKKWGIKFEEEYKFPDCISTLPLRFDFFLKECNTLIEYNGEQHYVQKFNITKKKLEETQKNDQIKSDYAKSRGFKLITIKYSDNIIKILDNELQYDNDGISRKNFGIS